ncbi:MAG: hypothetical protein EOO69_02390 [Moraxellaceae bacterium]|nr:MAG: hypothetical protein EOO69_02390 [Moraxellaceae bacterium]
MNLNLQYMSICFPPIFKGRRLLLCDEEWSEVDFDHYDSIAEIVHFFAPTHIGAAGYKVTDGFSVQLVNDKGLEALALRDLYPKFRAVQDEFYKDENNIDASILKDISNLILLGWELNDVGGAAASYDGIFPLASFEEMYNSETDIINKWGLFSLLEECQSYCQINNERNPESFPWHPVAIMTDEKSYKRLNNLYSFYLLKCKEL